MWTKTVIWPWIDSPEEVNTIENKINSESTHLQDVTDSESIQEVNPGEKVI